MRLLVLGGTRFLGRHVVTAALERGHEVATFTRGVSGAPPEGVRALHGDRDDPDALPKALDCWAPELVVDTSGQTRVAARNAAAALGDVRGYAFVSSLNAYSTWPPGPLGPEDDEPTWTSDDEEYGPIKAASERILGEALGDRFLTARAGLIVGPYDPLYRLGWWLDRIARGGRVVVPEEGMDQPIALVDARDLAGWLVEAVERGLSGAVNATGPNGMTTFGGLLEICREVTGSDAEWAPKPEALLLDMGVQPWQHLPMWLPSKEAPTAWDVDTSRARELGLPSRPLRDSVADTWAWKQAGERPQVPPGRELPGLPEELEQSLQRLDLDIRDLDEVRRRVVDPVVHSLVRPDELEIVEVSLDGHPPAPQLDAEGLLNVRVWAGGERITWWSWHVFSDDLYDAELLAGEFYERLVDDLAESRLAWGELREGDYRVPGPTQSGELHS